MQSICRRLLTLYVRKVQVARRTMLMIFNFFSQARALLLFSATALFLIGCSGRPPEVIFATQTAIANASPTPTVTPTATRTPFPSKTPLPTATPELDYAATIEAANESVLQVTQSAIFQQTAIALRALTPTPGPTATQVAQLDPNNLPCNLAVLEQNVDAFYPAFRTSMFLSRAELIDGQLAQADLLMHGLERAVTAENTQLHFYGDLFAPVPADSESREAPQRLARFEGRYIDDAFYLNDEPTNTQIGPNYAFEGMPYAQILYAFTRGEILPRLPLGDCDSFADDFNGGTLRYEIAPFAFGDSQPQLGVLRAGIGNAPIEIAFDGGDFYFEADTDSNRLVAADYQLLVRVNFEGASDPLVLPYRISQLFDELEPTDTSLTVFPNESEFLNELPIVTFEATEETCEDKSLVRYTNLSQQPLSVLLDGPEALLFEIPALMEAWFCVTPGLYLESGSQEGVRDWSDLTTCYHALVYGEGNFAQAPLCSNNAADYQRPPVLAEDPSPNDDNPIAQAEPSALRVVTLVNNTNQPVQASTYGNTCTCAYDFVLEPGQSVSWPWGTRDTFFVNVLRNGVLEDYAIFVNNGGTAIITDDTLEYQDRFVTTDF